MKLGFVNNNYQFGGAETVVRQLHFACRKVHKSFLFVADGKTFPRNLGVVPMYPRLLSRLDQSRFHAFVQRWAPRYAWTNRSIRKLAHSSLDLVHVHNFHGIYASIESLGYLAAHKPLVWTFHRFWGITGGCDHPGECTRYLEMCGRCPRVDEWPICGADNTAEQLQQKLEYLANAPIHIVAPSRHLAQKVAKSPVGKNWQVTHIPNGVDPDQFSFSRKHDAAFRDSLGLRATSIVVLIVNRDFRDSLKGFETIESALKRTDPTEVQFIFAGMNSDWAIRQLPGHFSCLDKGYLSSRTKMAELYEAADIFLFASPRENFPCVILEAMSAKCCVVSTPTDGVVEQVENGVSGFIADSFSSQDLANILMAAISSPGSLAKFGNAARERVQKEFTEQQMIESHLKLYEELCLLHSRNY
jgi:glycosyltransferase involved in cell wall biosynthesis